MLEFVLRAGAGEGSLALRLREHRTVLELGTAGLDRGRIERWLKRMGTRVAADAETAERPPRPLVEISSRVLILDARVESIARVYAHGIGATCTSMDDPETVVAALRDEEIARSVTLFLLADVLTEELCDAIWRANQARASSGRPALPFGFMVAPDLARLAWLTAKTLYVLARPSPPAQIGFADYDGFESRLVTKALHTADGSVEPLDDAGVPWTREAIDVAAVFTHGISFDASLGELALCGQIDPPVASALLRRAPVCYATGTCFRLGRGEGSPIALLHADRATPLCWFLNSCGAIALAGNAFGHDVGYAHGLLAGAAVTVIGPYVVQEGTAWTNRIFEALVGTGMTAGQTAEALSRMRAGDPGFHRYITLGSPDVSFQPERRIEPAASPSGARYRITGRRRSALRLALADDAPASTSAVSDDGGPIWSNARCQLVEYADRRDLVVLSEAPHDVDGWVVLGSGSRSDESLIEHARELSRRLRILAGYPFAHGEVARIEEVRALVSRLEALSGERTLLRRRMYAAALQAHLAVVLPALERAVARWFLEHVAARDFNFDRESYNGFIPGALARTEARCPMCRGALFVGFDAWLQDPRYRRRKDICANCLGISMELEASPLAIALPHVRSVGPGPTLEIPVVIHNRSPGSRRVVTTALPRHGAIERAAGPHVIDLAPAATGEVVLSLELERESRGTRSIRILVLAEVAAQFYSVLVPDDLLVAGLRDGAHPS